MQKKQESLKPTKTEMYVYLEFNAKNVRPRENPK